MLVLFLINLWEHFQHYTFSIKIKKKIKEVRLMMFSLNMVDYSMFFLLLPTWVFFAGHGGLSYVLSLTVHLSCFLLDMVDYILSTWNCSRVYSVESESMSMLWSQSLCCVAWVCGVEPESVLWSQSLCCEARVYGVAHMILVSAVPWGLIQKNLVDK